MADAAIRVDSKTAGAMRRERALVDLGAPCSGKSSYLDLGSVSLSQWQWVVAIGVSLTVDAW